jgi:predicted nucleic acid-binding protein
VTQAAIDTWAFLAVFFGEARSAQVEKIIGEVDAAFTVREVVAETYSAIAKAERRSSGAWEWWQALRESRIRVFEPRLDEVHAFIASKERRGTLSLADWALACVATRERTKTILSEDAEFRRVGLDPAFAK